MTSVLWLKAFHVFFMVAWFAGIFYLPRIFVNHAESSESLVHERFKGMERRLLYFISPFAVLTVLFGIAIIYQYGYSWFADATWLHVKVCLVAILLCYHGYCFKLVNTFAADKNKRSAKFYRIFNEVPVIILFIIVILAYVKPF